MDIADGLYGFFGTSDPATLLLDLLVAVVLAVSIVYLAMELYRIYVEYTRKETPAPVAPKAMPPAMDTVKTPVKETPKQAAIPAIDVVKGSLAESMVTLTQKYGLNSLTLASQDGLVIASTSKTPDQDAAIYSGLFSELHKVKKETYYYVESKEVGLYSIESGAGKIIGVAHRKGALAPEVIRSIGEDTKKLIDRFAAGK
jgi:predicted regulator of Ras-like GTPase activity (Roadblock/LC7/MglB family)